MTSAARAVSLTLSSVLAAVPAAAQVPLGTAFTYQGRLQDGAAPASGAFDFQFVLYDAAVGGSQVGPILTREDVAVAGGLFTVSLDFGAVFAGSKRWLEPGVRPGSSTGVFTPLAPRQELTPAPAAVFSAGSATTPWSGLTGTPAGFADGIDHDSGGTVTSVAAGAGLSGGTITTSGTLAVEFAGAGAAASVARSDHDHLGAAWSGAASPALSLVTSGATGLSSTSSGATGVGLAGTAIATAGTSHGVVGRAAANAGRGVWGVAEHTTGLAFGVMGTSLSAAGRGVYGVASSATGNSYGVYGEATSPSGTGVHGTATAASGFATGVLGATAAPTGRGVVGSTTASSGQSIGVLGRSLNSPAGIGVSGESIGSWGVLGESETATGVGGLVNATSGATRGVFGRVFSTEGTGVEGYAQATSGINYGVYGDTDSSAGYAGYFAGRAHVTGTLSKGAGAFKIDHPLDPENKYLYHSFVESPDMMNVYNGNVTTDAAGHAVVELPAWFEALNRDFRYQLTVIDAGEGWAQAKVARKVEGNRFTIRTSVPRVEVSWQVTGIRKDPYAEKHRIPLEEDKPAQERGAYLHPEAWGQAPARGLDEPRRARSRGGE